MERSIESLKDDVLVVRFGLMEIASLRAAAESFKADRGLYGVSAYGDNGLTVEETARQARRPHKMIRTTKIGRLKAAGFNVERTGKWPHLTITSGGIPDHEMLATIVDLFDDPIPNPHPVGRS